MKHRKYNPDFLVHIFAFPPDDEIDLGFNNRIAIAYESGQFFLEHIGELQNSLSFSISAFGFICIQKVPAPEIGNRTLPRTGIA